MGRIPSKVHALASAPLQVPLPHLSLWCYIPQRKVIPHSRPRITGRREAGVALGTLTWSFLSGALLLPRKARVGR